MERKRKTIEPRIGGTRTVKPNKSGSDKQAAPDQVANNKPSEGASNAD